MSGVKEEPPLDHGIIWSKCRSLVEPHIVHLPPSLFHTSSLTHVGIMRRGFSWEGTGTEKSSSPSTATSLNLNTFRLHLTPAKSLLNEIYRCMTKYLV